MEQNVVFASTNYEELDKYFDENEIKNVFLVCGSVFSVLDISKYFNNLECRLGIKVVKFSDFQPNPIYSSVVKGIKLFHEKKCDSIVAVGGGSAIDVAKCIKLYLNANPDENYLKQKIVPNCVKLLAIPTTAGSGSEATRFAVIYYNGGKQSISDSSCIPSMAVLDVSVLKHLPEYQRKSTMMDAFCHAIESFWSIHATEESKELSKRAIELILTYKDLYLANDEIGNKNMLYAAHISGKAINIAQTTAGHAMCYKLTSLYGIAHGHAAAVCVSKLWPYMLSHIENCIEPRGVKYLENTFTEIANTMGCETPKEAIIMVNDLLADLNLAYSVPKESSNYEILVESVNPVRLRNNPIDLSTKDLNNLYHQILSL